MLGVPVSHPPHSGAYRPLVADAHTVVDGAGMAAAAMQLEVPNAQSGTLRERRAADQLAETFIAPTLHAAATILEAGEFVGRARCKIDLIRLPAAVLLDD